MDFRKNLCELEKIDTTLSMIIVDRGFLENSEERKEFFNQVSRFIDLKRKVKFEFAMNSAIIIEDPKTKGLLQKINSDKKFLAEMIIEIIAEMSGERFDINQFNCDELEQTVWDELYSWFGPYEYIERLIEIGSLIVGVSIPEILRNFITEARQSYAFQKFNAVYSLCRTILETAMRDVGIRIGKIQRPKDDREFYKEYPPRKLINTVSYGRLRGKIHRLYGELSSLIHGYETVNEEKSKIALRKTLIIIQELYDKNMKS